MWSALVKGRALKGVEATFAADEISWARRSSLLESLGVRQSCGARKSLTVLSFSWPALACRAFASPTAPRHVARCRLPGWGRGRGPAQLPDD